MLKSEYIVNTKQSQKYNIVPKCNVYAEMGYSPRISLGFYPLDQKTYSLSKNMHPDFYPEKIIDKIVSEHNINYDDADNFVMNCCNLNRSLHSDYAWRYYYDGGITLILNKKILEELKISDYGMLADEICIDEPINLREYLEYVSLGDNTILNNIIDLLKKYEYDCSIIEFKTGEIIYSKSKVKKLKKT